MHRSRRGSPRVFRSVATLLLILLVAVGMIGVGQSSAPSVAAQSALSCEGTVNIHDGDGEPSPVASDSPKVCGFHLHAFGFPSGAKVTWQIKTQPGDAVVKSGELTVGQDGVARTGVFDLPDGQYKLDWSVDGCGGGPKSKVFKVECAPAPTATATNTPVPEVTHTPTPTNTSVPEATHTPTPTNTSVPGPTNTPMPTNTPGPGPANTPTPTNTPQPWSPPPEPTNTPVPPTATPVPVLIVLPASPPAPPAEPVVQQQPVLVTLPATGLGGAAPIDPPLAGFTVAMLAAVRLMLAVRGGRRDE